jgi:deoxycytidylate deaminase
MKPPAFALGAIERLASCSPCIKSKRAAVVFDANSQRLWGSGFNTPPSPMHCDGSDACRRDCGKICIHAEQMALRAAIEHRVGEFGAPGDGVSSLAGLTMLHVKVVDGKVVPGGPPSCWQCSREVLDAQLAGFWLYEVSEDAPEREVDSIMCDCGFDNWLGRDGLVECYNCDEKLLATMTTRKIVGAPEWHLYTAEEFHRETLKNCGLYIKAGS